MKSSSTLQSFDFEKSEVVSDDSDEIRSLTEEQMDPERAHWGSQAEFILSSIGFSVGLGNIWRFPYIALKEGGGAFLIPYALFLFLVGMPLFFMELIIGQNTGLSPVRVFTMVPVMRGIGFCMMAVCFVICAYYNVIMSWIIYYCAMSFQWTVPWSTCGNSWNTAGCYTKSSNILNKSLTNTSIEILSSAEEFWK